MFNPHIFRQYDIRGVVGTDVNEGVAEAIGRAFASVVRRRSPGGAAVEIVLGRDNRLTSDALAAAVSRGTVAAGVTVLDVGIVPTPVNSFAGVHLEADAALQVTGSHNPPEYNGFKMSIGGRSFYGEAIQELRSMMERGDFESGSGAAQSVEILDTYVRALASKVEVTRPVRVVVDCGNGVGSVVAVDLLHALGERVEAIPLFCESDGTFPNHHPDPVVDKNLQDLIGKVRETGADLGVAFDGDADRIGAVDEQGNIIRGDTLLLLFALDMISRQGPGQPVVFDVKCSQALPELIERAGGRPIMAPTGHSLIKERMKQEGALVAGELSGHIMFAENFYGFDDALYAACLLLGIVSRLDGPLSARIAEFPRYVSTAEIRYPATEETKFGIVARALEHFARDHDVIDVDGARVLFGDGWGLIRASNTEPVLVGRFEARTPERLAQIQQTMEDWLGEQGLQR
ncbi:MAG: phosphomannomutase/phosphoglucomutase [Gemmatimonadetes bacterium]|nr:phosphomannomutase/phosphoglucomutase [Gemmatimonadota bacterium]